MRRSRLKRYTPLTPGGRLRPVNRERKARRQLRNYGTRGEAVRAMSCLCDGPLCVPKIDAAHVKSRGAGGDRRSLVPLCRFHHDQQHLVGIVTFQHMHGLNLYAEAERIAEQLDREGHE